MTCCVWTGKMHKRPRPLASNLDLPSDILRFTLLFVVDTMNTLHDLLLVSRAFNFAAKHPTMLANIKFEFYYPRDADQLGSLMSGVQQLRFHTVRNLESFSLRRFPSLRSVNLSGSGGVRTLAQLGDNLPVWHLDLACCANLQSLQGAGHIVPHLRSLDLTLDAALVDGLEPLAELTHLEDLSLSFCSFASLQPLRGLVGLRCLDLCGCGELTNDALWDLTNLTQLVDLNLMNCVQVVDLQALSFLTSLHTLNLVNCRMTTIEPLVALPKLRSLNLANCCRLNQLCHLPPLRMLNVNFCPAANSAFLFSLKELQELHLGGAYIPDLRSLAPLESLQALYITTCYRLTDPQLLYLAQMPALDRLDLHECDAVTAKGVKALTNARNVKVTGYYLLA